MSQTSEMDDDLRPEYDFDQLPVVARGQGRNQKHSQKPSQRHNRPTLTVQLDPDVAAVFPDSGAVNEGLRLLMRLIQQSPLNVPVRSDEV
jgi:hypothetical protein